MDSNLPQNQARLNIENSMIRTPGNLMQLFHGFSTRDTSGPDPI